MFCFHVRSSFGVVRAPSPARSCTSGLLPALLSIEVRSSLHSSTDRQKAAKGQSAPTDRRARVIVRSHAAGRGINRSIPRGSAECRMSRDARQHLDAFKFDHHMVVLWPKPKVRRVTRRGAGPQSPGSGGLLCSRRCWSKRHGVYFLWTAIWPLPSSKAPIIDVKPPEVLDPVILDCGGCATLKYDPDAVVGQSVLLNNGVRIPF